jgi:hypothetical protein
MRALAIVVLRPPLCEINATEPVINPGGIVEANKGALP